MRSKDTVFEELNSISAKLRDAKEHGTDFSKIDDLVSEQRKLLLDYLRLAREFEEIEKQERVAQLYPERRDGEG